MNLLIFTVLSLLGVYLFALGTKILFSNSAIYKEAQELTGKKALRSLKGEIPVSKEGIRDYKVCAGMALDTKSKKIINQGAISDEVLDGILG